MAPYADVWFTSSDNLQLYARDYSHSNPRHTLLCLHGLTRNSKDFSELCEQLNSEYRVLAVDFRGRGRSEYDPNPANYQPLTYAEDMQLLLKAMQLEQVVIIGTSLGGLVAMLLAAQCPDKVSAIVINDIGPEINPEGLQRIKTYVSQDRSVTSWEEALAVTQQSQSAEYPDFSDEDWQDFTHNLYREDDNGLPILDYDNAIATTMAAADDSTTTNDLWPVFEIIKHKPILVVRGQLSDILSGDCVARMQQATPTVQYCEVQNRGHAPLLTEPASLQAIQQFLASLPPA